MSNEARNDTFMEEGAGDERPVTAATPHEARPVEHGSNGRGELIKFGVLALVLLGTVLVVALVRPLIFNQIVPAIMGEGIEPATQPQPVDGIPADEANGEAYPLTDTEPDVTDGYPAPTHDGLMDGADAAYPAPDTEDDAETAVITHTVRANENLTRIAEQYGVTVQAIIALNNITNPNRIEAGTVLQIPISEE